MFVRMTPNVVQKIHFGQVVSRPVENLDSPYMYSAKGSGFESGTRCSDRAPIGLGWLESLTMEGMELVITLPGEGVSRLFLLLPGYPFATCGAGPFAPPLRSPG